MDLSVFSSRLSDTDKARMMNQGLCFRCGEHGHISKLCPAKGKGPAKIRIDALEEDVQRLTEELSKTKTATGSRAEGSKNGGAQE
jgi:hypothetical protein